MKRRHFLQFASSTIATLGLSNLDIIQQGNEYGKVLAQSTPRKLALLVGINQYPNHERYRNLNGCVTDVQLQEKLLVHKFGFNPQDIIKLTTDLPPQFQPTRKNILQAFEEHLIKQAKPGDVVVFHFSGHGSRLRDPNPIKNCRDTEFNDNLNSTFVSVDNIKNNLAPDIMGSTLFLLRQALDTDNITMVLDSCFSGGGTRGNYIIRSASGEGFNYIPDEASYQQRWMEKLKITQQELAQKRCTGSKGIVITAAKRDEEAADTNFNGFSAGAFTYLLTQYLWQQTDTVGNAISQITDGVQRYGPTPFIDGNGNQPMYFINRKSLISSDAIITEVKGETATLWLGGIDPESLPTFKQGATFTAINNNGQASGKLELLSERRGLIAEAKLVEKTAIIQPGTPLRELSRIIPANLRFNIGLDPSFGKDINVAFEALSKINRIQPITPQTGNIPYPGGVECILSRMTADYLAKLRKKAINNLPEVGSIGLFTEGLEVIPESFEKAGETVTAAVSRLDAKLKTMLATLIIKKTLNANSSQLDVEVAMNLVDRPNQILARSSTLRNKNNRASSSQTLSQKLPLKQLFQFRVTNNTSDNLYLAIFLVDTTGGLTVAFPNKWNASNDKLLVAPNQTLIVGEPKELKLQAIEKGAAEALVIVSRSPLKKAVRTLQSLAQEQNRDSGALEINREPVEVISDLLDDLTSERGGGIDVVADKQVHTADIATLSISFNVG